MSNTFLTGVLAASVLLALPLAVSADSGHGDKAESASEGGHRGGHDGHGVSVPAAADLAASWAALMSTRDAIAGDVEGGALGDIHTKAEPLPELVAA